MKNENRNHFQLKWFVNLGLMALKSWISSNYSCFKQTRRLLEASNRLAP